MDPIRYVPELHFDSIKDWLRFWNDTMTPEALPQTGFIIPGKAAGFLYRTDSSLAFIENLVAAPGMSREERTVHVDAIVAAICVEAAKLGFKILLGYTELDAVVKRAERFGFIHVASNVQVVALPLDVATAGLTVEQRLGKSKSG